MPLSFQSTNRGSIAFGFFNIETDMLLLEKYFIFATDFCHHISQLCLSNPIGSVELSWDVYHIATMDDIGDLMSAIHGITYKGFIGEVYQKFPFPMDPLEFKQKTYGHFNKSIIVDIIKPYSEKLRIPIVLREKNQNISIGDYTFTRETFYQLLDYVWVGGYPRWLENSQPGYILEMKKNIEQSKLNFLKNVRLKPL